MVEDETSADGAEQAAAPPSLEAGSRAMLQPPPTPEEVAAILAAIEVAWPKPVAAAPANDKPSRWRFSGRWWSAPIPMRRVRPW
jgi:hypothetical protein